MEPSTTAQRKHKTLVMETSAPGNKDFQKPHNPHDSLVHSVFGVPEHAADLLKTVLPARLLEHLDVRVPVVHNTHFVSEKLIPSDVDLLYQVQTQDGQSVLVYIMVEHQSTCAPLMGYRVYCYIEDFWTTSLRQKRKEGIAASHERLPLIFPVVLYHGDKPWDAPRDVYDLIDGTEDLKNALNPMLPRLSYDVVDLTKMSDEAILSLMCNSFMRLCLLVLKYSRQPGVTAAKLKSWGDLWSKVLSECGGIENFKTVLYYMLVTYQDLGKQELTEFVASLSETAKGEAMTLSEVWMKEGEQKGRQEGILSIAKKLVEKQKPIDEIMDVTGLTREDIERLRNDNTNGMNCQTQKEKP